MRLQSTSFLGTCERVTHVPSAELDERRREGDRARAVHAPPSASLPHGARSSRAQARAQAAAMSRAVIAPHDEAAEHGASTALSPTFGGGRRSAGEAEHRTVGAQPLLDHMGARFYAPDLGVWSSGSPTTTAPGPRRATRRSESAALTPVRVVTACVAIMPRCSVVNSTETPLAAGALPTRRES